MERLFGESGTADAEAAVTETPGVKKLIHAEITVTGAAGVNTGERRGEEQDI